MFIIVAGLLGALMRLTSASRPPKVVAVSPQEATSMAALGDAALAYSASRVASRESPLKPGSRQLLTPEDLGLTVARLPPVYLVRPNVVRKLVQSELL